jgi:excisionase family DNA binding protein
MKERIFSTHAVAQMVGTNPSSVVRWIEAGKLKAYKTPGGHRRIREYDLRSFFSEFQIPLPSDLIGNGNERFVVVDADGRSAAALARALRKAAPKAEVTTVTDAVEALLRVGVSPPDALIIDGAIVDAGSLARALRAHPQTADTALVVLLPKQDSDAEKKLMAIGAKGVLTRPASADQILEVVRGKNGRGR